MGVLYSGLVDNLSVINVSGGGVFLTDWDQMGGIAGPLGASTSVWYPVTGGQEQDFQGGSIYWSSAGGTQEVHGPIYSEYVTTLKGPAGGLGFPNSPVESLPKGGSVSYFLGQMCNDGDGFGDGSAIYYLSSTLGAHEVQGCIFREYVVTMGGPGGELGFPVTDEQSIASGHVSYFAGQGQPCNGGGPNGSGDAIFDTPATGAHEVQGCIYATYLSAGGPTGGLGFPVLDEFTYDGSGDWESNFQSGYITWNATTGQTTMILYGCLRCQGPTSG